MFAWGNNHYSMQDICTEAEMQQREVEDWMFQMANGTFIVYLIQCVWKARPFNWPHCGWDQRVIVSVNCCFWFFLSILNTKSAFLQFLPAFSHWWLLDWGQPAQQKKISISLWHSDLRGQKLKLWASVHSSTGRPNLATHTSTAPKSLRRTWNISQIISVLQLPVKNKTNYLK